MYVFRFIGSSSLILFTWLQIWFCFFQKRPLKPTRSWFKNSLCIDRYRFKFSQVGLDLIQKKRLNGSWLEFFLCFQQGELEKLNQSTDDINRCETELEVSGGFYACLLTNRYRTKVQTSDPATTAWPESYRSAPLSVLTFDLQHGLHDPLSGFMGWNLHSIEASATSQLVWRQ